MGVITTDGQRRTSLLPNRVMTYLLIVFGIAAAALPIAANMDWRGRASGRGA